MIGLSAVIFATVVRVIDGDSFVVNLPCDFDVLCKKLEVRVEHIDAPELRGKCQLEKDLALRAKKITESYLLLGSTIVLANPKRDKYFRVLAELPNLEESLLSAGLAKRYEGGVRPVWCGK